MQRAKRGETEMPANKTSTLVAENGKIYFAATQMLMYEIFRK